MTITIHLKAYQLHVVVINVSIYPIQENKFSLLNKSEVNNGTSKSYMWVDTVNCVLPQYAIMAVTGSSQLHIPDGHKNIWS